MSQKANPTWIGAFVVGAVALAVAAVLLFGSGKPFESRERWVIFFSGSVSGLDEGAPVQFRGVQVGRVSKIEAYYVSQEDAIEIPVYVDIVEGIVHTPERADLQGRGVVETLIDRGLRAQLASQSLVTGKLYVSLDIRPDMPATLRGFDPNTPEIPSVPTVFQQAEKGFREVMEKMQGVDVAGIASSFERALTSADALLASPELRQTLANVDAAAVAVRAFAQHAKTQIDRSGTSLAASAEEARAAIENLEKTMALLQRDLGPGSAVQWQLVTTLEEVSRAAQALRAVAETLDEEPDSILFGRRTSPEPDR